jgi:F-type H+-transporting ATPase subunit alpha
MKFKADEIASVLQKEIEDFRGQMETAEVGRVLEVGDGIARCYGLASAMSGEMAKWSSFPTACAGWSSTWKKTRSA